MQRCPCCKARLKEEVSCPRCRADLQEIIRVQLLARYWFQKAIDYYLNKETQYCLDALTQSLQLQHSESVLLFRSFVIERQNQTTGFVNILRILQYAILQSTLLVKRWISNLTDRFDVIRHIYKKIKTLKNPEKLSKLFTKQSSHDDTK